MPDKNNDIDFSLVLASSVHDMKNSIGMLLASLESVISDVTPTSPEQSNKFKTLHYEASRINGELIQLLTIYRMQNDFLPIRIDEHYVIDMLEDQIARNFTLAETGGLNIRLECEDSLNWYYDIDLVGSVIHNIIVNGTRYTKTQILVHAEITDNMLCITIADDGSGFPDNMIEAPAKLVEEAEVNEGGTHLGLYFAEKIASMHKQKNRCGYIKLENGGELGGGIFKMYLP